MNSTAKGRDGRRIETFSAEVTTAVASPPILSFPRERSLCRVARNGEEDLTFLMQNALKLLKRDESIHSMEIRDAGLIIRQSDRLCHGSNTRRVRCPWSVLRKVIVSMNERRTSGAERLSLSYRLISMFTGVSRALRRARLSKQSHDSRIRNLLRNTGETARNRRSASETIRF